MGNSSRSNIDKEFYEHLKTEYANDEACLNIERSDLNAPQMCAVAKYLKKGNSTALFINICTFSSKGIDVFARLLREWKPSYNNLSMTLSNCNFSEGGLERIAQAMGQNQWIEELRVWGKETSMPIEVLEAFYTALELNVTLQSFAWENEGATPELTAKIKARLQENIQRQSAL